MLGTIMSAIVGKLVPSIADYLKQREELKIQVELERLRGKRAWEEALTKRASESEGRDHEWELLRIQDSGWKDEWVLGLLSVPLILVFIPQTAPHVLQGFAVLDQTPDWYQWLVLLIFTAVYGIRIWRRDIRPERGGGN